MISKRGQCVTQFEVAWLFAVAYDREATVEITGMGSGAQPFDHPKLDAELQLQQAAPAATPVLPATSPPRQLLLSVLQLLSEPCMPLLHLHQLPCQPRQLLLQFHQILSQPH